MRLTDIEKKTLLFTFNNIKGEIFLFGSRVNDKKKGGDIDILIITQENVNELELSLKLTNKFFEICEEKIDIIIFNKSSIDEKQQAFINTINKIELKKVFQND